jgi:hypothetical protein
MCLLHIEPLAGPSEPSVSGDAEVVRWTERGLPSYFRGALGVALLLTGATVLTTHAVVACTGWLAELTGVVSVAAGVHAAYSGLESPVRELAVPAFLLMLALAIGVLGSARREREPASPDRPRGRVGDGMSRQPVAAGFTSKAMSTVSTMEST